MSTNWAQLRQELKVITKQTSPAVASPAGGTRKRKMMVGTENKWKKARAEVVAASKSVQGTAAALSAVGPTTTNILALDCEYVGTGIGGVDDMLARVSIVNVDGDPIYDKYVRPTEEVVDYRTLVSGIRPGHLLRGISFSQVQSEVKKLLSDNIVIGHALHNDFKVLAITHPPKLIRDTAKCKLLRETLENPKKTPSLKLLAHHLLGVQIQQGEHDSVMDAKIALRIYLQYRGRWEKSGTKAKAQQHKRKRK